MIFYISSKGLGMLRSSRKKHFYSISFDTIELFGVWSMTRIIFALDQQFALVTNHRAHYRTNGPLIPGNYITILELVGSTEGIRSCFSALLMLGKHRPSWSHGICPCSAHPANLFCRFVVCYFALTRHAWLLCTISLLWWLTSLICTMTL